MAVGWRRKVLSGGKARGQTVIWCNDFGGVAGAGTKGSGLATPRCEVASPPTCSLNAQRYTFAHGSLTSHGLYGGEADYGGHATV